MSEPIEETHYQVVIVERGTLAGNTDPGVTGWTKCRCGHGVLLRGDEAFAKVTAGTWKPLCQECAMEIYADHPETFAPEMIIKRWLGE